MEPQPDTDQHVNIIIRWIFLILIGCCLVLISFRVIGLYEKVTAIQTEIKTTAASLNRETQNNHDSLQVVIGKISASKGMDKDSIFKMLDSTLKNLAKAQLIRFDSISPKKNEQFMNLLLLLVGYCGGLGACVHILGSFVDFWGNGTLKSSWLAWYVAKPIIGVGLALISFFLFQAGFFGPDLQPNDFNIHGILGMACLVGLFTDKASVKLSEIFDVIFKPKEDRKDPLEQNNGKKETEKSPVAIKILKLEPETITDKSIETVVTIKGENLSMVENLKVNGILVESTAITVRDSDKIIFKIGPIADDIKQLLIEVTIKGNQKNIDVGNIKVA